MSAFSSWLLIELNFWLLFWCLQCKHQLAARLAEAVGEHQEIEVKDEELADMLAKL
jgi:hypothetical protein